MIVMSRPSETIKLQSENGFKLGNLFNMDNEFNINTVLERGLIINELELEHASLAERQLKLLSTKNPEVKNKLSQIIELIDDYEAKHWTDRGQITDSQIEESDKAELIVQQRFEFIENRKKLIRSKLKKIGLNQQEFGKVLGHDSKSYISELMNGIIPFSLKDLVVISKLLKINLNKLIPTQIAEEEKIKIEKTIKMLGKPNLKLDKNEFALS
jgi:transcriptional regulator with XRE-family HTH domain